MPAEVILRLGSHAEKDYLIKTIHLFTGAIVGANLLEATPGATVSLAWKLHSMNKQFGIDPMTYVFALDLDYISSETKDRKTKQAKWELKRSFKSLAQRYGDVIKEVVVNQQRSVKPHDFDSEDSVNEACHAAVEYQLNRMKQICVGDPQLKEVANEVNSSWVLGPYFYIPGDDSSSSNDWEQLNLRFARALGATTLPCPKFSVLCIARRLLKDLNRCSRMLTNVMASGCDGCWIWINSLREEDITEAELANFSSLAELAGRANFPLWNMHGGFLSALLSKKGLSGFSHSIGYGESKDVLPVSGGAVPTVAYHYPPLHVRSSVPDIERAFSSLGVSNAQEFHSTICDCSICKGTLNGDLRNFRKFGELVLKPGNSRQSQTADSAKRCRFHFLLARKKELELVNNTDQATLREFLARTVTEYEQLGPFIKLGERAAALKLWITQF